MTSTELLGALERASADISLDASATARAFDGAVFVFRASWFCCERPAWLLRVAAELGVAQVRRDKAAALVSQGQDVMTEAELAQAVRRAIPWEVVMAAINARANS